RAALGHVGGGQFPAGARDLLVDHRGLLDELAGGGAEDEVALGVDRDLVGAGDGEADGGRVGPRGDDEVVLQALGGIRVGGGDDRAVAGGAGQVLHGRVGLAAVRRAAAPFFATTTHICL